MPGRDPFAHPEELLRRVYAYVAYRIGDRELAEDITSETFERALRYQHRFDESKGEPIAWLLGIARNCIYDTLLRPRRQAVEDLRPTDVDVEAAVVEKLTVTAALATLSASDRELLALRYGADVSPRQIGRMLDRRRDAVDVALSRARARLAAALEQNEPAHTPGATRVVGDLSDGAS